MLHKYLKPMDYQSGVDGVSHATQEEGQVLAGMHEIFWAIGTCRGDNWELQVHGLT